MIQNAFGIRFYNVAIKLYDTQSSIHINIYIYTISNEIHQKSELS